MTSDIASSRIHKNPAVCGDACIQHTRIPVWSVIHAQQLGASAGEVQNYFVTPLTSSDIQAAVDYYGDNKEEIDEQIRLNEEA